MARQPKITYSEGDLILTFGLERITEPITIEMQEWLNIPESPLNAGEQYLFDKAFELAKDNLVGWSEEDLKMNYISPILFLGHIKPSKTYSTFYEKNLAAVIDNIPLSVKADFMIATGTLGAYKNPYFHFQEYKPSKNPSGDSMAQLLEAMLIAQEKNKNQKPLYGIEIVGKYWTFVTLKDRKYCVSNTYNSLDKNHLLQIISILRHFIHILETKLIV